MPHNRAIAPVYDAEVEHILRRLGAAVVALWDNLDRATQERLVSQATLMHDRKPTVQLQQQIKGFIERHQGWPD